MALQPVDLAVVLTAAYLDHEHGTWAPAEVHRALELPWSTLNRSLHRLETASLVRDRNINRLAIAALLPVLRYLFPLEVDTTTTEPGMPTGFASPALNGRIRYRIPQVWKTAEGATLGHPVAPLLPGVPRAAQRRPQLGDIFGLIDAIRGGRARERILASERLHELLDLPAQLVSA